MQGQGRIITENEERLRQAIEENEALEKLYDHKQQDQDKINYKYQKAQSEYLEIMRELSRFRGEFLEGYSLMSKLEKTNEVHDKISNMMVTQNEILKDEIVKLDHFVETSQQLFESKLVNFLQNIKKAKITKRVEKASSWKLSKLHINAIRKQKQCAQMDQNLKDSASLFEFKHKAEAQAEKRSRLHPVDYATLKNRFNLKKFDKDQKEGTMFKYINGIKCFVKWQVLQERGGRAKCKVTVYSKIHSEPLELIDDIADIDTFNPKAALRRLRIDVGNTVGPLQSSKDIVPESPGLRATKQAAPTLSIYAALDDVYVEYFPETVYFMCP